jgi:cAMP-dependent protein kinase regulator
MVLGRKRDSDEPEQYLARKEYDRAIAIYRDRITKQSKNLNLRLALGDAYLQAGRSDEAIEEYRNLAGIYTEGGFIAKAIAVYKKILRIRPTMTEIEYCLMELSDKRESAEQTSEEAKSEGSSYLAIDTVLFSGLTKEEFRRVVSHLSLRHYEEETVIVSEGDPGESMFIVVNGEVRVNTTDTKGKQITLANLAEGEFFGEVSLLTGRPRTATIITNIPSDLLELTRSDFDKIVADFPHVREVLKDSHQQRALNTIDVIVKSRRNEGE